MSRCCNLTSLIWNNTTQADIEQKARFPVNLIFFPREHHGERKERAKTSELMCVFATIALYDQKIIIIDCNVLCSPFGRNGIGYNTPMDDWLITNTYNIIIIPCAFNVKVTASHSLILWHKNNSRQTFSPGVSISIIILCVVTLNSQKHPLDYTICFTAP